MYSMNKAKRIQRNKFIFRFHNEKQLTVKQIAEVYHLSIRQVFYILESEKKRRDIHKKLTGKEPIL
jgi:Mor family transcriptional regulator